MNFTNAWKLVSHCERIAQGTQLCIHNKGMLENNDYFPWYFSINKYSFLKYFLFTFKIVMSFQSTINYFCNVEVQIIIQIKYHCNWKDKNNELDNYGC